MDNSPAVQSSVKKQEDEDKGEKREAKPVAKTLNRVPRACNACRKQKMRCEGADNPPCKRCRNTNLECLFEKPSREATLTGEAGLERIRSLETHVAEIRHTQTTMLSTLSDLVSFLRAGPINTRSPLGYTQSFHQHSPNVNSPTLSTPTMSNMNEMHNPSSQGSQVFSPSHSHMTASLAPQNRTSTNVMPQHGTSQPGQASRDLQPTPSYGSYPQTVQPSYSTQHGPILPPFSSISGMNQPHSNVSSLRYQVDHANPRPQSRNIPSSGLKRPGAASTVTSANSSDIEEEDNGELPDSGLLAPWEVLRGLADVATERANKETGEHSEPLSGTRSPSPDRHSRPVKRRKMNHKMHRILTFTDVVTKNIITEFEARRLFDIYYHGCSTFLPIFDSKTDTFDALRERSPFAVDCICMVAAHVRDGAKPSETYLKILEEVQAISCATLFVPVMSAEAVQAMILVSGWSNNGWLSGGHAVRMAMELSMHKAWPRLRKRMKAQKSDAKDHQLVVAVRTWFCLYLFEHQMSYGTGRPAVLKDDESISECRFFLQHPSAIEDDMRLVSMVELMAIREKVTNALSPTEEPVKEEHFAMLQNASGEFSEWFREWDRAFSQKYEDAAFYRQSLQVQHLHAELYHAAIALRGINGPEDVQKMPIAQKQLALRAISVARQSIEITITSPSYSEGMKYAVHYTHVTATFTASFLLRLARLFPNDCDVTEIRSQVERLANLLSEIPGKRYAITLQLMLKRSQKRKSLSSSRSPKASRDMQHPPDLSATNKVAAHHARNQEPMSTQYQPAYPATVNVHMHNPHEFHMVHQAQYPQYQHHSHPDAEHIWRGFETAPNEQMPLWITDQSLGGNSISQNGMDALLLPYEYMPPQQQIW